MKEPAMTVHFRHQMHENTFPSFNLYHKDEDQSSAVHTSVHSIRNVKDDNYHLQVYRVEEP